MPLYHWEGRTAQGKVLKGEMEAASLEAVFARLRSQRIQPNPGLVKEKDLADRSTSQVWGLRLRPMT